MLEAFFRTDQSTTRLVSRVVLGLVMLPHGLQKMFGWFGGGGFDATVAHLTSAGVPAPLAVLVILGESAGAIGLVLGFCTRLCAFGITCTMLGAMFMSHLKNGFFMNWFGNQAGEGYEFHLLALALSVPLMIYGGGKWALDHAFQRRATTGHAKRVAVEH